MTRRITETDRKEIICPSAEIAEIVSALVELVGWCGPYPDSESFQNLSDLLPSLKIAEAARKLCGFAVVADPEAVEMRVPY